MTQRYTHYVDFPTNVSLNGSVAKISFGVGDSAEDFHTTHTIAMPIPAFLALTGHLKVTVADQAFQEKIEEALVLAKSEIHEVNASPACVSVEK